MSENKRRPYGSVKKAVLDLVQNEVSRGKTRFTYTEIHDFILDVTLPLWRNMHSSEKESRYIHRGQHTGMFTYQTCQRTSFVLNKSTGSHDFRAYNSLCFPNKWDSRHLVKIKRGLYEFKE